MALPKTQALAHPPSMGVTCGCVREPGSRTLPVGVGCMVFRLRRKTIHPTRMGWHAFACVFRRAQAKPTAGDLC
jgi:hypothetical protein